MKAQNMDQEQFDMCHGHYSDLYKEAYGFRPRFDISHFTSDDFEKEFAKLEATCKQVHAEEEAAEKRAANHFEKMVTETIKMGANDRATAIRWFMSGEGLAKGETEYFEYLYHLPYGYLKMEVL